MGVFVHIDRSIFPNWNSVFFDQIDREHLRHIWGERTLRAHTRVFHHYGYDSGHDRHGGAFTDDQHSVLYERDYMMDFLRQYILSLLAAAVICSILVAWLGTNRTQGAIMKLLAGVFMTVTLLSPLLQFRLTDLTSEFSDITADAQNAVQAGQSNYSDDFVRSIKQQTEAYILDKAAFWELNLEVEVTLSETDPPVPDYVVLIGPVSPYAKGQLTEFISKELGISKENQVWK